MCFNASWQTLFILNKTEHEIVKCDSKFATSRTSNLADQSVFRKIGKSAVEKAKKCAWNGIVLQLSCGFRCEVLSFPNVFLDSSSRPHIDLKMAMGNRALCKQYGGMLRWSSKGVERSGP